MLCDSFNNHIPNFYLNNHQILKILLKCANLQKNYFRPCYKANAHMLRLYLDPKLFLLLVSLKLVLNEQPFKCIQSSLITAIV